MSITVDVAELATTARQVEALAATERAKAAEQATKAAQAEAKAQAALAAAAQAEQDARNRAGTDLLARMRAFTTEVRAAFASAEHAVEHGGDVLRLWLDACLLRADRRGSWQALAAQYERVTGRPAPPGEWGYTGTGKRESYSGSVTRDPSLPGAPEDFNTWLTRVTARITARRTTDAKAAMRQALAEA